MSEANGVMMQYFHWYTPADGTLWNQVARHAKDLAEAGITALWLPPAYKATGGANDVGYGVYDLFDLGNLSRRAQFAPNMGLKMSTLKPLR